MKLLTTLLLLSSLAVFQIGCSTGIAEESSGKAVSAAFNNYWYNQAAEISSYQLEQARYGEVHHGHAVMVFVTEDFSQSKQVKLDNPGAVGKDAVPVLKLNFSKKFNTGIYPYSMMSSVFLPVNLKQFPNALKVTTSSQEWCGHTFTQLNLKDNQYKAQLYSYFESEGDKEVVLDKVLLEDQIWSMIRIDPDALPTGTIKIIPGTMFQRLRHTELKVVTAEASRVEVNDGASVEYHLAYENPERFLKIRYQAKFPYPIEGWEETYVSGFGASAKSLTTKATLDKTILSDYWNKHDVKDSVMRKELNLN